jgi:hypothetical protein
MLRYTASSVKQLAISSRSGLDHSAQNLVTTSSGEFIMPRKNAPAQTDISSPRPDPGVPRGDRQTPKTQLAKRWSAHTEYFRYPAKDDEGDVAWHLRKTLAL